LKRFNRARFTSAWLAASCCGGDEKTVVIQCQRGALVPSEKLPMARFFYP
jgi:hypothetical protein